MKTLKIMIQILSDIDHICVLKYFKCEVIATMQIKYYWQIFHTYICKKIEEREMKNCCGKKIKKINNRYNGNITTRSILITTIIILIIITIKNNSKEKYF